MHEPWILAVLAVAGLFAGFINTVAGAGSLLTLPVLMLTGMGADVANATNRVAVVAQSASGAIGFHRAGHVGLRGSAGVVGLTLVGAIVGALLASEVPERPLRYVLLGTMIAVGLLMWREPKPKAPLSTGSAVEASAGEPRAAEATALVESSEVEGSRVSAQEGGRERPLDLATALALFGAGLYGGFLQAGVGLVLLAIFSGLMRCDLLRANALKVTVVGLFSAASLLVFVARDMVVWAPGLALAAGSIVGAQVAVRFAVKKGSRSIRAVVLAMVVVSSVAIVLRSGW